MAKFKRAVAIGYKELGNHKVNRSKVFLKMCEGFKTRFPDINRIYAYINPNPIERLQFMLVFKFVSHVKSKVVDTYMTKYTIVCGNAVSFTSLEGFDICDERGKLDDWYKEVMTQPATYPESFFRDIINRNDDLRFDNKDPDKYWKNPKNATKLIEHFDQYLVTFYQSLPSR